jgi:hypothetical protein
MTRKGMFEEEVIIDHLPESLYLSIGLRTTNFRILMDNSELLKNYFKTMLVS